jgi:hypothetical protein
LFAKGYPEYRADQSRGEGGRWSAGGGGAPSGPKDDAAHGKPAGGKPSLPGSGKKPGKPAGSKGGIGDVMRRVGSDVDNAVRNNDDKSMRRLQEGLFYTDDEEKMSDADFDERDRLMNVLNEARAKLTPKLGPVDANGNRRGIVRRTVDRLFGGGQQAEGSTSVRTARQTFSGNNPKNDGKNTGTRGYRNRK